ncbi:MAG TPA: PH domain-containing protein [Thermoanaerobaculia bacterium]|nr:PH domain-containing protein [Thermoanaerobaculia bacterium]
MRFRAAPWSAALKIMSALSCLVLLLVPWLAWQATSYTAALSWVGDAMALICVLVVMGSLLFVVREYELDDHHLLIHRLLWRTRIDLGGLSRVFRDPEAFKGSIRLFGNGGLFSFSGLFYSRRLGRYRLFATDPSRLVVIVVPPRTVVISPADPEAFMSAAQRMVR